jgi:hypothetical protein
MSLTTSNQQTRRDCATEGWPDEASLCYAAAFIEASMIVC